MSAPLPSLSSLSPLPPLAFLGAGNLAGAILHGLIDKGVVTASAVTAIDVREGRLAELAARYPGLQTSTSIAAGVEGTGIVVIAVKPQVVDRVLPPLSKALLGEEPTREALVISVAAGIPIAHLERQLHRGARVIRSMPNTPALVQQGATAYARGHLATDRDAELAHALFSAVGVAIEVPEAQLDAATGLSGSGPAYVFLILEALADAGVQLGLSRAHARTLATQTVLGAAQLAKESGEHPAELKDRVASPGGTTIDGLYALERGGLRATLMEAVVAAATKARKLAEAAAENGAPPKVS